MQSALNDKENQIPKITMDFKKKGKSKPNSARTNSNSSLLKSPNAKLVSNNTIALLQKKRQYSESLREKNSQRKSRHSETLQDQIKNEIQKYQSDELKLSNISPLNNNGEFFTNTQNHYDRRQNTKSTVYVCSLAKREQKGKLRDVRRQKNKIQQTSILFEGHKGPHFNSNFSIISISENQPEHSMLNPDVSVIEKINELSHIQRGSQICSKQIDFCIGPFQTEQTKENELIKKQNSTFKKELANFRKQNAALKRQAEELRKKLAVLSERNQYLQNQSTQHFQMIESLRNKVNQLVERAPLVEKKEDKNQTLEVKEENQQKLKEIIANYENQLFQTTNLNKKLQFKTYMLQKKLMDEGQIHKKQMAKEISVWKQRYIKARNENLRLKDSRSMTLFEMSISQQM